MSGRSQRRRSRSIGTETKLSTSYLDNHINSFEKTVVKIPKKNLKFITIRDPKNLKSMDWVRKLLLKFCSSFMLVCSPVGGTHYHALCHVKKKIPYKKGIHFNVQPVGCGCTDGRVIPAEIPIEHHPFIKGRVGALLLDVLSEIRQMFGGPKSSLFARKKSRVKSLQYRTNKKCHVSRLISYLVKNYQENPTPAYYSHMNIRLVDCNN